MIGRSTAVRVCILMVMFGAHHVYAQQGIKPRIVNSLAEISNPDTTVLEYASDTGDLRIHQRGAVGVARPISAFEIKSVSGVFLSSACPLIDCYHPNKFFVLTPQGVYDETYSKSVKPGLTHTFLAEDWDISGALIPSGGLTDVVLLVPEPSACVLLGMAALSLGLLRVRGAKYRRATGAGC